MQEGDYIKFDHPNGSIGQIESKNHYGGFYVKWIYGRDAFNEIVSAKSSCTETQLVLVSQQEYIQARDRRFNSS